MHRGRPMQKAKGANPMSPRLITIITMLGIVIVLSISVSRESLVRAVRADHDANEKYLFVWAGNQARVNPDFLAVTDFDEHSNRYGTVITTVPLPSPGATGNEPHHVGLSADGKVLAA